MTYHGLGKGIVFMMRHEQVFGTELDEFTCPIP